MKIIKEEPVTMAFVKKELENIKKRDKELSFRSGKTEDYLNQFVTAKNFEEVAEKLRKLDIPRLKEEHIVKILDVNPLSAKDLKAILSNFTLTISAENAKKIINAVEELK